MGTVPWPGAGRHRRRLGQPVARRVGRAAVAFVAGAAAACAVAVAWVPFRGGNSDVVVALALVAVVTASGVSRRRAAVVGAVGSAAAAFTFFDTEPYERFAFARQPDLATAVSLVVVGGLTGEMALRWARNRRAEGSAASHLRRVREAAALLADGEEVAVLIGAVAEELASLAGVDSCSFSAEALPAGMPLVARDGTVDPPAGPGSAEIALPVWASGRVAGHFVLRTRSASRLGEERLRVAVTLADQAGAALAAQAPPPAGPPGGAGPAPRLRVVRNL